MPVKPDAPLRKVTLNLYDADCDALAEYYGRGWTEQVRQVIHSHTIITISHHKTRKTLGDLE